MKPATTIRLSREEYELLKQAQGLLVRKGSDRIMLCATGEVEWDGTLGSTVGVAMAVLISKLEEPR